MQGASRTLQQAGCFLRASLPRSADCGMLCAGVA
jgi:hypothetical protein